MAFLTGIALGVAAREARARGATDLEGAEAIGAWGDPALAVPGELGVDTGAAGGIGAASGSATACVVGAAGSGRKEVVVDDAAPVAPVAAPVAVSSLRAYTPASEIAAPAPISRQTPRRFSTAVLPQDACVPAERAGSFDDCAATTGA